MGIIVTVALCIGVATLVYGALVTLLALVRWRSDFRALKTSREIMRQVYPSVVTIPHWRRDMHHSRRPIFVGASATFVGAAVAFVSLWMLT